MDDLPINKTVNNTLKIYSLEETETNIKKEK